LSEGQKVVASGQFLIDSEASLKSVLPKFAGNKQAMQPAASPVYRGIGTVEKVTPKALTLSHKPIPELEWGAMTMDFNKSRPELFSVIKAGQEVEFSFKENDDGYLLESVKPVGGKQ